MFATHPFYDDAKKILLDGEKYGEEYRVETEEIILLIKELETNGLPPTDEITQKLVDFKQGLKVWKRCVGEFFANAREVLGSEERSRGVLEKVNSKINGWEQGENSDDICKIMNGVQLALDIHSSLGKAWKK